MNFLKDREKYLEEVRFLAREKKRIYAILALLYSEDEQFSNYWFGQLSEGSGAQRLRAGIMLKQCRNLNLISRLSMYLVDEDPEAIQYIGDRIVTSPSLASAHAILGIVENSSAVPANVRVSMKGLPDMDVRVTGWTLNWLLENERVLRVKDFGGLTPLDRDSKILARASKQIGSDETMGETRSNKGIPSNDDVSPDDPRKFRYNSRSFIIGGAIALCVFIFLFKILKGHPAA